MRHLNLSETLTHLQVSSEFLAISVEKGRLTPINAGYSTIDQALFDANEVEKFGELLQRLKTGGIATMVNIAAGGLDKFD